VVTGSEDGARREAVINLIEDRLVELIPVELGNGRRITDATASMPSGPPGTLIEKRSNVSTVADLVPCSS
jgi:hypothetical protein